MRGKAARRLDALKHKAAQTVATIEKHHPASAARDAWTARESDWRKHRSVRLLSYASPGAHFGDDRLQWCEDPAAIGLRFVGFADEIFRRSYGHRRGDNYGYFTRENDYDDTLRGAVYQWPARGGKARFVAGYREGSTGRDWKTWRDAATGDDSGGAAIALSDVLEFAGDDDSGPVEAARRADGIAESMAEREREYNAAWSAGAAWAEAGEAIAAARREALQLLAEMRAAGRKVADATRAPAICAALRQRVDSLLEAIGEQRAKRSKLAQSVGDTWNAKRDAELRAAFNEGASESVL